MLRYLAIEYPKEHDVGDALIEVREKVPDYLKEKIPVMRELLYELARVREPAMYGYEREGIPASKAFGREYANEKLKAVKEIVEYSSRFIAGIF
ncbi:MAG: HEPN domain-containing protein [Methanocellales archaeon]